MVRRPPDPCLARFFSLVWACGGSDGKALALPAREHMLPTGRMHLVFRMTDGALQTLEPRGGALRRAVGTAVVAGVRPGFYVRERTMPVCSVGAVLRPGTARLLFGVSAAELSGHHAPLEAFWGSDAGRMRERLLAVTDCRARLAVFESLLRERLRHVEPNGQGIVRAIAALPSLPSVAAAAERSGLSHRSFIARFRDATGLAPKRYLRILRFQDAIGSMRAGGAGSLALKAAQAGYSDQAHFSRDFLELSGVTPREYLRRAPVEANHLPVAGPAGSTGQDFSRRACRRPG